MTFSSPNQHQRQPRVQLMCRAMLEHRSESAPCVIQDASRGGFFLVTTRKLNVGDHVKVNCDVSNDANMTCLVQVRHRDEFGVGTEIVSIDERSQNALLLLVQ